jgi:hypothetical protein
VSYTIGLLMVNDENDVLERTLDHNSQYLDAFYVLDGSADNTESERICRDNPKCWGYRTDSQLPRPPYPVLSVCGYRQFMLDHAYQDHGFDNWFMVLHADELWTADPRPMIQAGRFDGYIYLLPFYFPRDGERWQDDVHPIDQLHWHLGPGWPEFRLFRGGPHVAYDPQQRFNTRPSGIHHVGLAANPIWHYPYRAPDVQRLRAATHERTQFDPDNYRHIVADDAVFWTDDMIAAYRQKPEFAELHLNQVGVR